MTEIRSLDELFDVLARSNVLDDGESVDLLAHSLQSAQLLSKTAPDDIEIQIAGLLHDLGTMLEPGRPDTHAHTGADAARPLLGERVAALIGGHDQAKRYLVSSDPEYRSRLSETSVLTLTFQGGDMNEQEQATFAEDVHFDDLIRLRRADDAAKVRGRSVPGLDVWRERVEQVAAGH